MLRSRNKVIGITMGDPQGVGPEVIIKALTDRKIKRQGSFVLIGDARLLNKCRAANVSLVDVLYQKPGEGSLKFLDKGIEMIKGGVIDALVTAPLSKERVSQFAKGFVGHTEYLAAAFDVKQFDMMFVADQARLTIVTRHVPLKEVSRLVTKKLIFDSVALMHETLKGQFGIKSPKIAVLGLNPHAGENGLLGKEEARQITPAIKAAVSKGIKASGPYPADTFFINHSHSRPRLKHSRVNSGGNPERFDGIIAMYHDQGLAPMKGLYFKQLVNFTAGLPFVRTSPVHGTAFDIAGKNIADASSMKAAIQLACQLV